MAEYYFFSYFKLVAFHFKKSMTILLTILLNHPILNLHCEAPKK